ncbi:hypothetical protein TNIN_165141, partial [Trichonephila inaurata madagascariensis]
KEKAVTDFLEEKKKTATAGGVTSPLEVKNLDSRSIQTEGIQRRKRY